MIGGGIGGLSAALDLAIRGLSVTVIERAACPGGKMREVEIQGQRIDSGPTVLTMAWVFEQLFADAGTALSEHIAIRPAKILARHAWRQGGRLDLFADIEQSVAAIAAFAGGAEADRFRRFQRQAARVFQTLDRPFMRRPKPSVRSLIAASGWRALGDLWRIKPFRSLWRELGDYFHDPRLRGLFARYSTYSGASPLQAPATLMLIAHVEQRGVWQIDGGMQRLAEALATQIRRLGGKIICNTQVDELETRAGRAVGARLQSGQTLPADVVVANVDAGALRRGILGATAARAVPPQARKRRSLSAVTWSLLTETSGFELAHHNVFFPDDYPREFEQIFSQQRLPETPAVYVCAQTGQSGDTPAQHGDRRRHAPTRLFMITNAPANGDQRRIRDFEIERLQSAAFGLLEDCGLRLQTSPEQMVVTTPNDFEQRFPGTGGALYGSPPHGWRSAFSRPVARSRVRGLYLVGGSVHPGPGVPMVALGGRLAAAAIAEDLGLPQ